MHYFRGDGTQQGAENTRMAARAEQYLRTAVNISEFLDGGGRLANQDMKLRAQAGGDQEVAGLGECHHSCFQMKVVNRADIDEAADVT